MAFSHLSITATQANHGLVCEIVHGWLMLSSDGRQDSCALVEAFNSLLRIWQII